MAAKAKVPAAAVSGVNGLAAVDVLTLGEAAALLRVSEGGLRSDAEAGKVPGRFIAGEWRFSQSGLLEWLASAPGDRLRDSGPQEVIRKGVPHPNAGFLLSMGAFADDESLGPMVEEIYRDRKRGLAGG